MAATDAELGIGWLPHCPRKQVVLTGPAIVLGADAVANRLPM